MDNTEVRPVRGSFSMHDSRTALIESPVSASPETGPFGYCLALYCDGDMPVLRLK